MNQHRNIVIVAGLILLAFNGLIVQKEVFLARGESVYLELAPVDPRSLMQGDYMQLNYDLSEEIRVAEGGVWTEGQGYKARKGRVIVTLDARNVLRNPRVEEGPVKENERLLQWKRTSGLIDFGIDAYHFQEGLAEHFSQAKYAEVKLGKDGGILLVGLLDEDLKPL